MNIKIPERIKMAVYEQLIGSAPFLCQVIGGVSPSVIDAWIVAALADHPMVAADIDPFLKKRLHQAMLSDFLPSIALEAERINLYRMRFPDIPPTIYENCVIIEWAPPYGVRPDGTLTRVSTPVKIGGIVCYSDQAIDRDGMSSIKIYDYEEYRDLMSDVRGAIVGTMEIVSGRAMQ